MRVFARVWSRLGICRFDTYYHPILGPLGVGSSSKRMWIWIKTNIGEWVWERGDCLPEVASHEPDMARVGRRDIRPEVRELLRARDWLEYQGKNHEHSKPKTYCVYSDGSSLCRLLLSGG